jgi:uncharacterized damage-inducible protein DinB
MRPFLRATLFALALVVASSLSVEAQQASSVAADLREDIEQVERKLIDLARAIPEERYSWRPGAGVRSIGEVLLHVSADNYLIPSAIGYPEDAASGVKGSDYNTALAFEKKAMNKAATIAELERSFGYLKKQLSETPAAKMTQPVSMFGMSLTGQKAWIMTTTHLHEHLGQLIAYARSNGVAPPWS